MSIIRPARGAKSKIFFWERIAFRISAGFLLPAAVSGFALYSVSTIYSELSETKEKMERIWNSVHISDSKAVLSLTKLRMHSLTLQYEGGADIARQLDGLIREFSIDIGGSRRSLDGVARDVGISLETSIKRSYDDIGKRNQEMLAQLSRLVSASQQGNSGELVLARKELDRIARETEMLIARLRAQNDRFESAVTAKLQEEEQRTSRTLGFYLITVLLFAALAAIAVTFSITSPVKNVLLRIQDIATGDGDLTKRVATRAGGEMKELADWLNLFLEKTHGIIATIAHASSTVSGTTAQVGKHAEQMTVAAAGINRSMMEQSMNIDECTHRVGSIDDLIQNAGESTRQAASLSKIAMDRALQGGASVHETIEAMEKIEDSAKKIEELVSSINEIASQTNLLAINAAIEATKAGEHGKGFAVVAEEVRKLAERARKLTAEVTGLIGESSGRVKAGVGLARNAGISLDGIIKDVEAVVSLIQRIASASAKQTESSTVALDFMRKVADAVRQNLEEMQGVARSSECTANEVLRLDTLVSQLNEVVGQFRLASEEAPARLAEAEAGVVSDPGGNPGAAPAPGGREPLLNPELPGELSFEAMMNPASRPAQGLPLDRPPAAPPGLRGIAPLPPGVVPDTGDEEAA